MKKLIDALKRRQGAWHLAHFAGRFMPTAYFRKLPRVIKFEATNICNLRCPVCPTHFAITRDRGYMGTALFKSVIDEFVPKKKKPRVAFSMSGEPLLNKDLPEFIAYANQRGHTTYISTNVTQLNPELSRRLISSGLATIHLAVEGTTKESHEAYRIGSDFTRVKRNIEAFMAVKRSLNSASPLVVIQTLLTSFSEKEIDDIVAWAKEIGADRVTFKSLSMGTYTDRERKQEYGYLLPKTDRYLRKSSDIKRTLCRRPFWEAVVYWDGTLGLCCVDFDGACRMPNIAGRGFIPLWRSKPLAKIRKQGFLKRHALCKSCSLGAADWGGFSVDLK